jgi:sirohydrochlorin cobaltochelatase
MAKESVKSSRVKIRSSGSPPAILLACSGTLVNHAEDCGLFDARVKKVFPEHSVYWMYTTPHLLKRLPISERGQRDPSTVLEYLQRSGAAYIIVQPLYLICGTEFHRLLRIISSSQLSWSLGLPLLSCPADFENVLNFAGTLRSRYHDIDCLVLVAHGTDHPAWTAYSTLSHLLRERFGNEVCLGTIGFYPGRKPVISALKEGQAKTVHLIPFLFCLGNHLRRDIIEGPDSWKRGLESLGYTVTATPHGLSRYPEVVELFLHHLQTASQNPILHIL